MGNQKSTVVTGVLAVSPKEAGGLLGVGVTMMYELMNAGEVDTFKIGRASRITMASIKAYIARQVSVQRASRELLGSCAEAPAS